MNRQEIIARIRSSTPTLSVCLHTADIMNLGSEIKIVEDSGASLINISVMDGRIWREISVGSFFVAGIKSPLLKDVRLLVEEPEYHIASFVEAGADLLSFSIEYCRDIGANLSLIERAGDRRGTDCGILRGVSVNPDTPIETIFPYLNGIDFVVLLTVGPATGKKNFLRSVPERVSRLRKWKSELLVFVDGSIGGDDVGEVAQMGVDVIVSGESVFDGVDAAANLAKMNRALGNAAVSSLQI